MGALTAAVVSLAALSAVNSYSQSKAQKSQGDFQSQQLEANARIADIQADDAIKRGESEAKAHRRRVRLQIGEQRAGLAAQGLDLESGSALDIQKDTAGFGAEDEVTIKNNAFREAWGYKVQANDYRTGSQFTKMSSKTQSRQTLMTGGLSALKDLSYGYYLRSKGGSKTGGNTAADADFN